MHFPSFARKPFPHRSSSQAIAHVSKERLWYVLGGHPRLEGVWNTSVEHSLTKDVKGSAVSSLCQLTTSPKEHLTPSTTKSMGRPCWLVHAPVAKTPPMNSNHSIPVVCGYAPPCTDPEQILPFIYQEQTWYTVDQCYHAQKFVDPVARQRIHGTQPCPGESSDDYGRRIYKLGSSFAMGPIRDDWDMVKIDVMAAITLSKYTCHPHLQEDLWETGQLKLYGPAYENDHPTGMAPRSWSQWHGWIHMWCREMLKSPDLRNTTFLQSWTHHQAAYRLHVRFPGKGAKKGKWDEPIASKVPSAFPKKAFECI